MSVITVRAAQLGFSEKDVTSALATSLAGTGQTAPNFRGAIGVTADSVEGVDIAVPVYQFAETHYQPDSVITPTYKGTLFSLTGRTNNGAFKGFAAGEVLFLGAAGSKRGLDPVVEKTPFFPQGRIDLQGRELGRIVLRRQKPPGLPSVRPQHRCCGGGHHHAQNRQTEPQPSHRRKTAPFAAFKMVCQFCDTTAPTKEGLSGDDKIVSNLQE